MSLSYRDYIEICSLYHAIIGRQFGIRQVLYNIMYDDLGHEKANFISRSILSSNSENLYQLISSIPHKNEHGWCVSSFESFVNKARFEISSR